MLKARPTPGRVFLKAVFCYALTLAVDAAGTARAADICADVRFLIRHAHANFSTGATGAVDDVVPLSMPGAETCAVTRSPSAQKHYHCTWQFGYRATAAYDTFDAFNQSLQACFGDGAEVSKDQSVNHPDFYDLRRYRLGQIDVTVSIKDKSAVQRTYVFVRIYGRKLD